MTRRLSANGYILIAGQALSTYGDYAARTALTLYLLDKTGSAFSVGMMLMMNSFPAILGVSAGWFTQRFSVKRLLVTYTLLGAVASMVMTLVTGKLGLFLLIYLVYFLMAILNSLYVPTRLGFVGDVVHADHLKTFNSLDQTMEALVMAGGIASAAYLYVKMGINVVFIVNALSFVLLALALGSIRVQPGSEPAGARRAGGAKAGFREGYRAARANPSLLFLTLGVGLSGLAVGIVSTMFVIFIRKDLGGTDADFSQISSVRALVSSLVGFSVVLFMNKVSDKVMVVGGYLAMGLAVMAMSLSSPIWLIYVWNVIMGGANVLYYVAVRTQLQKLAEPAVRTQFFAFQSAVMRFCLVGAAGLSGIVSDAFGIRASWELLLAGIIFAATGVWSYRALPSLRTVQESSVTSAS